MDDTKLQRYSIFILFLFITSTFFLHSTVAAGGDEKQEHYTQIEETKTPIIDTVKRMFSLPTGLSTPSNYWMKVLHYISPPNLDFRGRDEERVTAGGEGATEKVKEAMVKCVDKTTETVQNSPKSAAKFAEEAVGETVKKLRRTLSGDHEDEL